MRKHQDFIKEAKHQCMLRTINKRFSNITGEEENHGFVKKHGFVRRLKEKLA